VVHKALLRFVVLVLTLSVVASLGCRRSTATASRRGAHGARAARTLASIPADDLTDTARVLAGLPPAPSSPLAKVAAKPEWQAWQREFDSQWTQATKDRFAQMSAWRDRELAPVTGSCNTLMYPFAGPDILNAFLLFPNCKRYVLFGLEPVGSLPALDQLSAERLTRLLDETRHALNDLLARNYFITSHMMKDTAAQELRGTLPLMAVSLVRMNARLVSVRDMEIAENGELRARTPPQKDRRVASALELVFERPGHEPQTVVYFRAQAEDKAINLRPGVLPFLERQAPFPTFLKSASYLLHGNDFSIVRNLLLEKSRLILEDDSGIPLRYLKAPEWTVSFYGKYDKPIKDFNYGYQPDMAKVYSDPRLVKPLTFSFGYHWADGEASVLLAVRNPQPPAN
jgi:hypothetical protein